MTFVETESELQNAMKNLSLEKRLIGIYANRHMEYEYVREQFVSPSVIVETYYSEFTGARRAAVATDGRGGDKEAVVESKRILPFRGRRQDRLGASRHHAC